LPQTVDVSGKMIRLSVDLLNVMYIRDKQMLACNFIFEFLWTGKVFLNKFYGFLGFCELK